MLEKKKKKNVRQAHCAFHSEKLKATFIPSAGNQCVSAYIVKQKINLLTVDMIVLEKKT